MRLDSLDTDAFLPGVPVPITTLEPPRESRARRLRRNTSSPITNSTKTTPPATPPPIAPALVDLDDEDAGSVGELEPVGVGVVTIVALNSPEVVAVIVSDVVVLEFEAIC